MGSTADIDASKAVMETNLYGGWRVTQALLPLLRRSSAPRIVNMSSGAGSHEDAELRSHRSRRCGSVVRHQQGGAERLTSTLATELAQTNVLVNAICPGLTATWPGAENMGARPVEVSATGVVWAIFATSPSDRRLLPRQEAAALVDQSRAA